MEPYERIESITTKEELAEFVTALREDYAANGDKWENQTLDSFLEAMARWIPSMNNAYRNTGRAPVDQPTWRTFADILLAATIYE
jgi:hypothetical protein